MATRQSIAVSWLILLVGCGGHPPQGEAVAITDSAGVEVVYSSRPRWASDEVWAIAEVPERSIGVVAGPEPYQFYRVGHAGLLPDGGVWVVHSFRPPEFRIYDGNGEFVRSIGGEGEGPGEFRGLSEGWLAKDGTLVAYDANLDRISRFSLDGHLIDSRPIEIVPPLTLEDRVSRPRWFDRFSDGSLLGQPSDQLPERTGRARAEFAFTRLALATLTYDTVSLALGPEWVVTVREEGSLPEVSRVEFTSMSIAVAYDSTAFVSDNKDFWVEEVGPGGRVLRRFGRASEAGPVTRQDLEDYGTERLASAQDENQRRLIEQSLPDMAFADSWPAHGTRMLVDADGNLWVALRPSATSDVLMWSVFDSLGVWLGDVPTPGQLYITEIHSDAVVGVWRDDLNVQTVRVYELRKPDPTTRSPPP